MALPFAATAQTGKTQVFNRIATFEAASNVPAGRNVSKKSVAEIVAASPDGRTLVYTDGEQQGLGFINLANPAKPQPGGFVAVDGEPTSVVVSGGVVLAGVSTTKDFTKPGGFVVAIDLKTLKVLSTCDLGGQPDALALDKGGRVLSVVIENERDERLNKGVIPQLPAGNLTLIPLSAGRPDCAAKKVVALTGMAAVAPTDPEPELVKVNALGEAIVSLQENNHFAVVNVATGAVVKHFSAGTVDLMGIDRKRDGQINPVDSATGLKREPDAVAWLDNQRFVSANEGDYEGGSRTFSIFNKNGTLEWDSGALLEHIAMRHGHYPEHRSGSKGTEPEGIEVGRFGNDNLIFVGLERASLVVVFKDMGAGKPPQFIQVLPAGSGPEGITAIPQRNLLVVAAENDGAARSTVMIYQRGAAPAAYPHLVSADVNGLPIPWGAISGLAADRKTPGRFYAVTDSAYAVTRVLEIDTTRRPAVITRAFPLTKAGQPVGFDGEGIVQREDGGFWIASEGDPEKKPNPVRDLLIRVSANGAVQEEIELPEVLRQQAVRFGLEGVTTTGSGASETVWLAVQREWKNDPKGIVKILSYQVATKTWGMLYYPLDVPAEGAWMGLSEITAVGPNSFIVIERDNTFGANSRKTLHMFSTAGITPAVVGSNTTVPTVAAKRLIMDLKPIMLTGNGYVLDKVESFAIDAAGEAVFITDNDAVDGSNGETQLIRLGRLNLPAR